MCGLHGQRAWTERPDRSTPSTPVHDSVRVERRQLYLAVRRHLARMARVMAARGRGQRKRKLVLRETGRIHSSTPVT